MQYSLAANVENLIFTSSYHNSLGFGNARQPPHVGGAGNDTLRGDAGNDTLDGGAGADG